MRLLDQPGGRAWIKACASTVFLTVLLGGCGGTYLPVVNLPQPSAQPSLSPPIPGDQPPLPVSSPNQSTPGRLSNRSPYPLFTMAPDQVQGDPVNLIFIGTRVDLRAALKQAGWLVADSLTAVTRARMVRSHLLHMPYPTAPVSNLFVFGRVQDLAFEKNSEDTRRRDHFRVWQSPDTGSLNRSIWVAAATRDIDVAINKNTGFPTHKISPNVDTERDLVESDLLATGRVDDHYRIAGVGKPFSGSNGSGDYVYSDGMIVVISLKP